MGRLYRTPALGIFVEEEVDDYKQTVFSQTQQGKCTEIVTVRTRLVQGPARQKSQHKEEGGCHQVLPLAEEHLIAAARWRAIFNSRV